MDAAAVSLKALLEAQSERRGAFDAMSERDAALKKSREREQENIRTRLHLLERKTPTPVHSARRKLQTGLPHLQHAKRNSTR